MDKMTVFQVVIVVRGKEGKGDQPDQPDRLLTEAPTLVLAKDPQMAAIEAIMDYRLSLTADERQRVEVLARPF